MAVDDKRLSELRRYEDRAAGVSDEFLEQTLGPGRALALLSSPLAERSSVGWVIVPSIGPEHGNLRRLETMLARSLAAAGFPTLRIRPDLHPVHGALGEIDVSTRIVEADEAVALVSDLPGVEAVGVAGLLFGGTIAALAADRLGAAGLALVEPVTRGKRYIRETVRRQAIAELIASTDEGARDELEEDAVSAGRPLEELASSGSTTVRGLRLSQSQFELISAIDLERDLERYRGATLLVGLSLSGAPRPGLRKLAAKLESLHGRVDVEVLDDPLPAPFGEYYYRNAGPVRIDTRLELDQRIAALTAAWAMGELIPSPGEAAA
jgi:hypothetical protein